MPSTRPTVSPLARPHFYCVPLSPSTLVATPSTPSHLQPRSLAPHTSNPTARPKTRGSSTPNIASITTKTAALRKPPSLPALCKSYLALDHVVIRKGLHCKLVHTGYSSYAFLSPFCLNVWLSILLVTLHLPFSPYTFASETSPCLCRPRPRRRVLYNDPVKFPPFEHHRLLLPFRCPAGLSLAMTIFEFVFFDLFPPARSAHKILVFYRLSPAPKYPTSDLVKGRQLRPAFPSYVYMLLSLPDRLTTNRACQPSLVPLVLRSFHSCCFLSPPSLALDDRLTSRHQHLPTSRHRLAFCASIANRSSSHLASLLRVLAHSGSRPLIIKNYELTRADSPPTLDRHRI